MTLVPKLKTAHLEAICAVLGNTDEGLTGSQIGKLLILCGIADPLPGTTKRHRLFAALNAQQYQDNSANRVLEFVQMALDPARFLGRAPTFGKLRSDINQALAFCGLRLREDGNFEKVTEARTLSEAQERAGRLRSHLNQRDVHPDVLIFCRAELLQENYFHAVFEATKSVAEKIRQKTGLTSDGVDLVDKAFGLGTPLLAINTLKTETEQSEQKGFASLLKGMFGTFRNVMGHAPKLTWPIAEADALDILSLISYLHRRLDASFTVPPGFRPKL